MKTSKLLSILSQISIAAVLLAACSSSPTAAPTEMMKETSPAMTEEAMMTEMLEKQATEEMAGTEDISEPMETGVADTGMAEGTMEPEKEMMDAPAWLNSELVDVNSGETFKISDFSGKVVLVETMAIWCPKCLKQQQEVKSVLAQMGMDAFEYVVLDVDLNEDAEQLAAYTQENGFEGRYAVAPREVSSELSELYGSQFLNPTSTPMLIVDTKGEVHVLPFGIKSTTDLADALDRYLDPDM